MCPLMQTLEEYVELLLDADSIAQMGHGLPPRRDAEQDDEDVQNEEGVWSKNFGRLTADSDMRVLRSVLDSEGKTTAEVVAADSLIEEERQFIQRACEVYGNYQGTPIFPAGAKSTLLVSSERFWQSRSTGRTLFPYNANSFPSAYKVLAIARNYRDGKKFYVYVVWQPLFLIGGGVPLLRHVKYNKRDGVLEGLFAPFEVDVQASQIDKGKLEHGKELQLQSFDVEDQEGRKFQRILFKDSWVAYNSRRMARHTVFAVMTPKSCLLPCKTGILIVCM